MNSPDTNVRRPEFATRRPWSGRGVLVLLAAIAGLQLLVPAASIAQGADTSTALLVTYSPTTTRNDALIAQTDVNYYKFDVSSNDTVEVVVTTTSNSGLLGMAEMFNKSGSGYFPGVNYFFDGRQGHLLVPVTSGRYYLKIHPYSQSSSFPASVLPGDPPDRNGAAAAHSAPPPISFNIVQQDSGTYRLVFRRASTSKPFSGYSFAGISTGTTALLSLNEYTGNLPTNVSADYGVAPGFGTVVPNPTNPLPASLYPVGGLLPLTGLNPSTSYTYRFISQNSAGIDTTYKYYPFSPFSFVTPPLVSDWSMQTIPGLGANAVQAIALGSAKRGIASGTYGYLLRTTDGGTTWNPFSAGVSSWFTSVCMFDSLKGVAVGGSGAITVTTDGGASWTPGVSGSSAYLYGVTYATATTLYAVGASGTILKSTTGGATWASQTSGISNYLYTVRFVDANTGMAVGDGGTILWTTNGGTTWVPQTSGTGYPIYTCWMFDANTAIAPVYYGSNQLRTTNGGGTWTTESGVTAPASYVQSMAFYNASDGVMTSSDGTVFRTTNRGVVWHQMETGLRGGLYGIAARSYSKVVVAGDFGTILSAVAVPPAAPRNLSVQAGDAKALLQWNANAELDFARYRIYAGTSPAPATKADSTTSGITDTTHTITGLTNGTRYYVRITAVDQGGLESAYSNEVSITPHAVPVVTGFSPASGRIGTPVVITGSGFDPNPLNNAVWFGTVRATVSTATAGSIVVTVPSGASYQPITVTVNGLTASSNASFATTFYADRSVKATSFASKVDFATGSAPFGMASGDFDGSGRQHVVVVNFLSNTLSIFRNAVAAGPFTAKSLGARIDLPTGLGPQSVVVGDVDGDGKLDLLVANNGSSTVSVFRNVSTSGTIGFAARQDFVVGSQPASIALRDLDGDGRPDIVTTNNSTDSVSVLRNQSSPGGITNGSFAGHVDFAVGLAPNGLAIGDVDGDGKPDIVVTNQSGQSVSILRNTGVAGSITASSFASRVTKVVGNLPVCVTLVDLDGDGALDIVTANQLGNSLSVLRNTSTVGSVSFAAATSVSIGAGTNPYVVKAADIDGDGSPDLVVANQIGSVSVVKNSSTVGTCSFGTAVAFTAGNTPDGLLVADLEGSGKPSLCVANSGSGTISLLKNLAPYTEVAGNNSAATAMPMAYGDSVDATLAPVGEADYFSFVGAPGDSVTILVAPAGTNTLRAYVQIFDSLGAGYGSYYPTASGKVNIQWTPYYTTRTYYLRYASYNNSTSFPLSVLPGPGGQAPAGVKPPAPNFNMTAGYADTGSYRISVRRFAPGVPDIESLYPTSIFANAAVLGTQVITNGDSTMVKFEYGMTATYGNAVSAIALGGRFNSYQSFSFATISGLAPNTTYHYRCTVANAFGSYTSDDYSFTTPDWPVGWMNVASNSVANFSDVSFPNVGTGYAVGGNYQVGGEYASLSKTSNGGISWVKVPVTWNYGPSAVSFVDASTGLVADGFYILRTTDGGTTWTNATPSNSHWLYAVQFVNPTKAYAVGDYGTILKSTNGGSTWTGLTSGLTSTLRSCYFADQFNGWIVGDNGTVLQTTDGGTTWANFSNPTYGWLRSVWFVNPTMGYAAGGGAILRSTDAGATWATIPGTYSSQAIRFYSNQTRGAAVGSGGTVWLTPDSGKTWTLQKTGTTNDLYAVAFSLPAVLNAVGNFGTILHRDTVGTAPSVSTNPASAVTTVSAALNGTVNPGGIATQAWFQYGTTSGIYSQSTSLSAVGSGTLGLAYADTIRGLTPGATYYYRIAAQNSLGTTYGLEASVRTPLPLPPVAPSQLIATAVSSQDVNLQWTDNSDNELWFRIQRRLGGSVQPFVTIDSVRLNMTAYADHLLTPATLYVYRVYATNAIGSSGYSNTDSASTQPIPASVPTPPTNLVATKRDTSRIDLTWTSNSDNELKFLIEQGTTGSGPWQLVDSTGPKATSRTRTGLTPGTTYYFRVRASNQAGPSGYTNTASATTQALLPLASLVSTKVDFGNVEAAFATRDTLLSLTNNGAATLNIASITLTDGSQFSIITGFQAGALPPGQSRTIRVRFQPATIGNKTTLMKIVSDDASQGTPPGTLTDTLVGKGADVTPPGAPTGLTIAPNGWSSTNQFTLTWSGPSDPSGIDSVWYRVDSMTTAVSPGVRTSVTGNSAVITIPTQGSHPVFAYFQDSSGNRNPGTASMVTAKYDASPPTVSTDTATVPLVTVAAGVASPAVAIPAQSSDNAGGSGLQFVQLQYRKTGSAPVTAGYSAPLTSPPALTIPGSTFISGVTAIGVDYRVVASDSAGNQTATPWYSIRVRNAASVPVSTPSAFPAASSLPGAEVQAYRIFSVPYILQDRRPSTFMESSLGQHASQGVPYVNWKMSRWVSGQYQQYEDFKNDTAAVHPGAGFFLAVKDPNKSVTLNNEVTEVVRARTMSDLGIPLLAGWNLVGDPLVVSVPYDSLTFVGGTVQDHAYYTGTGPVSGWEKNTPNANMLVPWQGLAIRVSAAGMLKFRMFGPQPGMRDPGVGTRPSVAVAPSKANDLNWRIGIDAVREDNGMMSVGNAVGMADGAKEGYDGLDSFQPPLLADRNVAVYSENADGGMTEDLRPLNPNGAVWPLRLLTGDRDAKIHLTLRNAAQLPNTAFEAYLIDDDQQMVYNLKTVHSVTLNSMQGTRALRLLVGTRAFVLANQGAVEAVPTTMRLSTNYPNPFNPTTTIRYTVPGEAAQYEVTLMVYNMLGQEVRSLVSEMQSAGYYEVTFDARNLSTGVYFYRIGVGGPGTKTMTAVKKMMLVK